MRECSRAHSNNQAQGNSYEARQRTGANKCPHANRSSQYKSRPVLVNALVSRPLSSSVTRLDTSVSASRPRRKSRPQSALQSSSRSCPWFPSVVATGAPISVSLTLCRQRRAASAVPFPSGYVCASCVTHHGTHHSRPLCRWLTASTAHSRAARHRYRRVSRRQAPPPIGWCARRLQFLVWFDQDAREHAQGYVCGRRKHIWLPDAQPLERDEADSQPIG